MGQQRGDLAKERSQHGESPLERGFPGLFGNIPRVGRLKVLNLWSYVHNPKMNPHIFLVKNYVGL